MAVVTMLELGKPKALCGFVTRLNAIGPTDPGFAESMLGYRAGFLAQGYYIGQLIEPLRAGDVRFGGGTQYSGGRMGEPATTRHADEQRRTVHDTWVCQLGDKAIARMALAFVRDKDNLATFRRIIKIVSVGKADGSNPALDFPPGRQAPQYILTRPHTFLIAARIDAHGVAETAEPWTGSIAGAGTARNRDRLYRYLRTA